MKLTDGTEISTSLKWSLLYKLEQTNPQAFEKYRQAVSKMERTPNEIAAVEIIYTGYLCANLGINDVYSFDEFLDLLPDDHVEIINEYVALYRGKKK